MIKNKRIRQVLFYSGVTLTTVGFILFIGSLPVVGGILFVCGLVSVLFAFHKLSCSSCGKSMWEVSVDLKNCPYCGASYADQMTIQQSEDEIKNER